MQAVTEHTREVGAARCALPRAGRRPGADWSALGRPGCLPEAPKRNRVASMTAETAELTARDALRAAVMLPYAHPVRKVTRVLFFTHS